MKSEWYCTDCETRIDSDEIDDHESQGHHVKGQIQPERLIGNDPHNVTVLTGGDGDDESGDGGSPEESTEREVSD